MIQDETYTPFPTIFHTERPDVTAANLLEGGSLFLSTEHLMRCWFLLYSCNFFKLLMIITRGPTSQRCSEFFVLSDFI
ncbi:spore germination protein [Bacillus sonorensis]|nr:spore germination protein [Bacillus sonorensis]